MEFYKTLLEENGYNCDHWVGLSEAEFYADFNPSSAQPDQTDQPDQQIHKKRTFYTDSNGSEYIIRDPDFRATDQVYVCNWADEQKHKITRRYVAPYKHSTHFKEHLRRLQALEQIPLPETLIQFAKTNYPHAWRDSDMFMQCKQWMRKNKINRKYYEHIFQLASCCGGFTIRIPGRIEYLWCHNIELWVKLLTPNRRSFSASFKNKIKKMYMPRYHIVLQVLLDVYKVTIPYRLPRIADLNSYQLKYNQIKQCVEKNNLLT